MRWNLLAKRGCLLLACTAFSLTGCQHVRPFGAIAPSMGELDVTSQVTGAQAADVHFALGRTLEQRGDLDQAKAAYFEAVKRDSRRADAYLRLAIICDRQGDFAQSAHLYQKALQAAPGNPDIYCDMGYSLYLQRRWDEAEMNLRQTIVLKEGHQRAHNNLGMLLARTGRADEALAEFARGGCSEAETRTNLALAYTVEQRWDEARFQYELALGANPSFGPAQEGLRNLQDFLGRAQNGTVASDTIQRGEASANGPAVPAITGTKTATGAPAAVAPAAAPKSFSGAARVDRNIIPISGPAPASGSIAAPDSPPNQP